MDQLMQKLMLSKAIMDKSDGIKRGTTPNISLPQVNVQNFDVPDAKYNIPAGVMQESAKPQSYSKKTDKTTNVDAIVNSKLPDSIKKLMIEHPIHKPEQSGPTLSNELVEKASRLMKEQNSSSQSQNVSIPQIDNSKLQVMVENAVRKVLSENGLISESEEKTNETFSFKVGKHIFEGKVTKIKKLS
jgi:hypothetical protein